MYTIQYISHFVYVLTFQSSQNSTLIFNSFSRKEIIEPLVANEIIVLLHFTFEYRLLYQNMYV